MEGTGIWVCWWLASEVDSGTVELEQQQKSSLALLALSWAAVAVDAGADSVRSSAVSADVVRSTGSIWQQRQMAGSNRESVAEVWRAYSRLDLRSRKLSAVCTAAGDGWALDCPSGRGGRCGLAVLGREQVGGLLRRPKRVLAETPSFLVQGSHWEIG